MLKQIMNESIIKTLNSAVRNFVVVNADIDVNELNDISLDLWHPLKVSAICIADLDLSYVSGRVDQDAYSRAKQTYQIQMQNYHIAYNQYVQAENQFQTTINREKNLEWHQKSNLVMPRRPSEPIAPDINDYVEWDNFRSRKKFASNVNAEFLLQENNPNKIYFDYLHHSLRERKSYANLIHKISNESDQIFLKILKYDIDKFGEAIVINDFIVKEVDDKIKNLFYHKAENYMEKWYARDVKINSIDFSQKNIKFNTAELYVGNYNYKGKTYRIVINKTNMSINGDLPSNFQQIKKFAVTHIFLLFAAFFVVMGLFSNYWEDFLELNIILIVLNYLGFVFVLLNQSLVFRKLDNFPRFDFFGTGTKSVKAFVSYLSKNVSYKNSGFNGKMISMDLSRYMDRA